MGIILMFTCVILIAILVNFTRKTENKRFYHLIGQFPSYPTYPLIGNAHMMVGSIESVLAKIEKYMQPFDNGVYWLGPIPLLFLKKCEDIVTILNGSVDRDELRLSNEWLGIGLLTARCEEWKKSRRILAPAFSSDMLIKYVQVFNKSASNLVEKFAAAADSGQQIDVSEEIMRVNLDTIVENSMGISTQNYGKEGENFCHAVLELVNEMIKRMQYPWLLSRHIYMIYLKITRKIKIIEHLHHLPTKILKENTNNNQDLESENNSTENVDSSKAIIDLLIRKSSTEPGFNETRIRSELIQMLVAQKAYEDITQLTADNDQLTENHLTNHLKYLDKCIQETLRMFSPVIVTSRRVNKEFILTDNKIVPANALVVALIHLSNQDPDLFENPQKWDPEHFSDEAIKKRSKSSHLSFGYGPRSCIGAKYAMMSIKTQIAYILRHYHLSTSIKELTRDNLKTDISIRSKIGYPIRFTKRREVKS